jgi:hypothetical protein
MLVEEAGGELFSVLITRKLLILGTATREACISLPISLADDGALWLVLEPLNELLVGRVVLLGNDVCGECCGAGTTR